MNLAIRSMEKLTMLVDERFIKKEREKARSLRSSQWWKRKRASGICHYCQNKFPPGDLTMDHIIPLARGGKTQKFNIAACCKACNTKKKQVVPFEWEEYMNTLRK